MNLYGRLSSLPGPLANVGVVAHPVLASPTPGVSAAVIAAALEADASRGGAALAPLRVLGREFVAAMTGRALGVVMATLAKPINVVVGVCAHEQVARVHARPVVAGVADDFIVWDRPNCDLVRETVGLGRVTPDREDAVPVIAISGPLPASSLWDDLVFLVKTGGGIAFSWHVRNIANHTLLVKAPS